MNDAGSAATRAGEEGSKPLSEGELRVLRVQATDPAHNVTRLLHMLDAERSARAASEAKMVEVLKMLDARIAPENAAIFADRQITADLVAKRIAEWMRNTGSHWDYIGYADAIERGDWRR